MGGISAHFQTPRRRGPALAFAVLSLLGACAGKDENAARYAARYEAAMAANDLWSARVNMQKATSYDDANAEYWAALGQVQLKLADFAGAYNSFLHASELDRSNPAVLQALADMSVMSGQLEDGRKYANQVLVLRPSDAGPQATLGFAALRDHDYEEAIRRADLVLAIQSQDSNATVLKGRALSSLGRGADAIALLRGFAETHARDEAVLDTLATVSGRFGDLKGQEAARARLLALRPEDPGRQLSYAAVLYALGQDERAHDITLEMARTGKHGGQLIDILGLWKQYEPRARSLADVRSLAAAAGISDRMRYAYYLLVAGFPAEAEALVAPSVSLPVTPANASPLALVAQARAMQGRRAEAEKLLDAVIAFDRSNVMALRARTDLYLATGRGRPAVFDAQALVAEKSRSADDRVRLSRAYALAGQKQLAENALRAGIQEIPASPLLYRNLQAYLRRTGRTDELADIDQQYLEQKRLARAQW